MIKFDGEMWVYDLGICCMGGGSPSYTAPATPPPAAQPATMASSSVAAAAAKNQQLSNVGEAGSTIGTSAQGVAPSGVQRAVSTLGGVN